jgi:hypothetical protein
MLRSAWTLSALLMLVWMNPTQAAEGDPAGTWKLNIYQERQLQTLWIIELQSKDGQWTGTVVAAPQGIPKGKVENLQLTGDILRFSLKIESQTLTFEGKLPKEKGGRILGTFSSGQNMTPGELETTTLRSFDPVEQAKEALAGPPNPAVFEAARDLLSDAAAVKAKPEEVRGWAEKALKAAGAYGPRWQKEIGLRITEILNKQEPYAAVALEYARRTERMLEPADDDRTQTRVIEALAAALRNNNKAEEAKELETRLEKLEAKADAEYVKKMPPVQPEPYRGRKEKSDRVMLVELFTGTECPPCVAADLAFDALTKTYKPTEAVFLEYHLHVPRPDPLTNPDSEARQKYYGEDVSGTPASIFNGLPKAEGGGSLDAAKDKYFDYRDVINPLLEKPARAHIRASATRQGDKIDIQADVSDLDKTGEKVRLRFALVEDQIRYVGGNHIRFHHNVVRALPGGAAGFPLKEKSSKQTASVDLTELRKKLTDYLDAFAKKAPFPNDRRPLDLKNLRLIAFVQDDETKEVLQATQVDIQKPES